MMTSFSISAQNESIAKLSSTNNKFKFSSNFNNNKKEEIKTYLENEIGLPKINDNIWTSLSVTTPHEVRIKLDDELVKIRWKYDKKYDTNKILLFKRIKTIVKDISNIIGC